MLKIFGSLFRVVAVDIDCGEKAGGLIGVCSPTNEKLLVSIFQTGMEMISAKIPYCQ